MQSPPQPTLSSLKPIQQSLGKSPLLSLSLPRSMIYATHTFTHTTSSLIYFAVRATDLSAERSEKRIERLERWESKKRKCSLKGTETNGCTS